MERVLIQLYHQRIFLVARLIIHFVCTLLDSSQPLISPIVGFLLTFSQSVKWFATDFLTNITWSSFNISNISKTGLGLCIKVSSFVAQGSLGRNPSLANLRRWKLSDKAHIFILVSASVGHLLIKGLMAYSPVFLLVISSMASIEASKWFKP